MEFYDTIRSGKTPSVFFELYIYMNPKIRQSPGCRTAGCAWNKHRSGSEYAYPCCNFGHAAFCSISFYSPVTDTCRAYLQIIGGCPGTNATIGRSSLPIQKTVLLYSVKRRVVPVFFLN